MQRSNLPLLGTQNHHPQQYSPFKKPRKNNIHLFTGSIIDPFKTGPTGLSASALLIGLGKSGSFHVVPKPASFLWREESVHDGYGDGHKLL